MNTNCLLTVRCQWHGNIATAIGNLVLNYRKNKNDNSNVKHQWFKNCFILTYTKNNRDFHYQVAGAMAKTAINIIATVVLTGRIAIVIAGFLAIAIAMA